MVYSTDLTWLPINSVSYTYPTNPVAGNMFWNPGLGAIEVYDGSRWQELAEMSYVSPQIANINADIQQIQSTLLTLPNQQILQQQMGQMVTVVNQLITAVHAIATATNTTITLTSTPILSVPATTTTTIVGGSFTAKGSIFNFIDNNGWAWF